MQVVLYPEAQKALLSILCRPGYVLSSFATLLSLILCQPRMKPMKCFQRFLIAGSETNWRGKFHSAFFLFLLTASNLFVTRFATFVVSKTELPDVKIEWEGEGDVKNPFETPPPPCRMLSVFSKWDFPRKNRWQGEIAWHLFRQVGRNGREL